MRKRIFITLFVLTSIIYGSTVEAQSNIAFVNTIDIINSLPDKVSATDRLNTINQNYRQELQIMQNEYNKKYSDFITYQDNLAESIKLRRMQELTDLESRIQNFTKLAQKDIEEHETHGIYIYDSSYVSLDLTLEMIEEGYPLQAEVEFDDPRVTHRYYYNLEGLFVESVNIEDIEEFESQNIVIYGVDYSKIQREFICECVRNNQADAVINVLKLK